jgi:rare lipoprotein A
MNRSLFHVMAAIVIPMTILSACTPQVAEPTRLTPTATAGLAEAGVAAATATPQPESAPNAQAEAQVQEVDDAATSKKVESDQWDEGPITFKSASLHGNATASGEPFDKDSLTGAHKDLPFDTEVTVINLFNGKSTLVRINDRLPANVSAVIDISPAAAEAIDMIDAGIVDGRIEW